MDGSAEVTSLSVSNIQISFGIALYEDTLFWTQFRVALAVNKKTGYPAVEIFQSASGERVDGIKVVHPSKQPSVEEFLEKTEARCKSPCVHGTCVGPGLCLCDSGWRGVHCSIDKDECQTGNDGCDQNCTNLPGSYACSCFEGYFLDSDDRTCNDEDECQTGNSGCDHNCTNLPGSYTCSCLEGYSLDSDDRTCNDEDECQTENGGCDHNCTNLLGTYNCSCLEGYSLDSDNRTCNDTGALSDSDECEQLKKEKEELQNDLDAMIHLVEEYREGFERERRGGEDAAGNVVDHYEGINYKCHQYQQQKMLDKLTQENEMLKAALLGAGLPLPIVPQNLASD